MIKKGSVYHVVITNIKHEYLGDPPHQKSDIYETEIEFEFADFEGYLSDPFKMFLVQKPNSYEKELSNEK
uniref:Uncharacterized protein n=1 Tax=viral metagenome TaxID=1070528 RepID=A0A6M3LLY6_9ZZZZ